VDLITSDRDADPATLAARIRGHWEIENACCAWDGRTNIADANRHRARDPQRTLTLLQAA